jgi:hypothetical protein
MVIMLQLHEFWTIDNVPDDNDKEMDTLEQFEQKNGLTKADRGRMPEFGYLGAVPLTAKVVRPTLEILGEPVPVEEVQIVVSEKKITAKKKVAQENLSAQQPDEIADETVELNEKLEESLLLDIPVIIKHTPVPEVKQELPKRINLPEEDLPELRELSSEEALRLRELLGVGKYRLRVRYQGRVLNLKGVGVEQVPEQFLCRVIA